MPCRTLLSSAVTRPASTSNTQGPTQKGTVHRFTCLFTHDVRRKNTKRWQDGYLSFHSFNGRVQVHDELKNFIGDTFYKDGLLDDGDELNLDRVGVLVQVGERKSVEETDLTELLSKRQPKQAGHANGEGSTAQPLRPQPSNVVTQTQRRWTGWAGRAQVPIESPHAQRQAATTRAQKENEPVREPPRKRPRQDDEHIPLWQLLKTTRPSRSQVVAPAGNGAQAQGQTRGVSRVAPPATKTPKTPGQTMFRVKEIIDITESSSDRVEPHVPTVAQPDEQQRPSSAVTADGNDDNPVTPLKSISRMQPRTLPVEAVRASPKQDDPGGVDDNPAAVRSGKPLGEDTDQHRPRAKAAAASSVPREQSPSRQRSARKPSDGATTATGEGFAVPDREPPTRARTGASIGPAAGVEQPHSSADRSKNPTKTIHRTSTADIIRSATKAVERPPQRVSPASSSPPVCTTSHVTAEEIDLREDSKPADLQHKPANEKPRKPLRLVSASAPKKRRLFAQTLTATKANGDSARGSARSPSPQRLTSDAEAAAATKSLPVAKKKPSKTPPKPLEVVEPEVITLEEDSQEAFEVMQPKTKRRKRPQRAEQAQRNTLEEERVAVQEQTSNGASTNDAETGHPSITNQPDQRRIPSPDVISQLEQRTPPVTKISYGTAPLDARYLSQMVANMGGVSNASLQAKPTQPQVMQGPSPTTSIEPHRAADHKSANAPAPRLQRDTSDAAAGDLIRDISEQDQQSNLKPSTTSNEASTTVPRSLESPNAQAQPQPKASEPAETAPAPTDPAPDQAPKAQPRQEPTAPTSNPTTTNTTTTTTTTAPPLITAQTAASRTLTRPFRRVTSEVSPKKRPTTTTASKRPFKRAETISVPEERTRTREQDGERGGEGPVTKAVGPRDADSGAWSREAWDLFGGCPAGRAERPLWPYDHAAVVAPAVVVAGSV